MESLDIVPGKSTPRVYTDLEAGVMQLEGKSYPENASAFYKPVFDWLMKGIRKVEKEFILRIDLVYFNTSSSKALMMMFDTLDEAFQEGKKVKVEWLYEQDNTLALETGEDFQADYQFPFEIISYPHRE